MPQDRWTDRVPSRARAHPRTDRQSTLAGPCSPAHCLLLARGCALAPGGPAHDADRLRERCGLCALPAVVSGPLSAVNEARFPKAHDAPHVLDRPRPAHPSLPTPAPVPSDACWGLTDVRQLVSPSPCFSLPQAPSEGVGQPSSAFLLRQGAIQAPHGLSAYSLFSPELSQALGPARVLPCLVSTHAQGNWTLSSSHVQRDQEKSGGP